MTAFRFFTLLPFIITLFTAGNVFAHAVVTEDSLRKEAIRPDTPSRVSLAFNSGIEVGLSTVALVREGDIEEKLPIQTGKRPGEILVELPALEPGDYALHYKIFAADGHLTDDVLRFTVKP